MSTITSIVLLMGAGEFEELEDGTDIIPALDRLNEWLKPMRQGSLVRVDQPGGDVIYHVAAYVAIGAFNYLNVDGFIRAFREAGWQDPECAQLMLMREEDNVFTEYRP